MPWISCATEPSPKSVLCYIALPWCRAASSPSWLWPVNVRELKITSQRSSIANPVIDFVSSNQSHPRLTGFLLPRPLLVVEAATVTLPVEFDMLVLRHSVSNYVINSWNYSSLFPFEIGSSSSRTRFVLVNVVEAAKRWRQSWGSWLKKKNSKWLM